jgi:hypothetical protein
VGWANWSERSDRIALVAHEVSNNRCWLWAEPRIASDTGTGVIAPCFGEERGVALEFNVLALIKGDERYVYVYDDESRATLVEMFHQLVRCRSAGPEGSGTGREPAGAGGQGTVLIPSLARLRATT